jgi:hypothetical protein
MIISPPSFFLVFSSWFRRNARSVFTEILPNFYSVLQCLDVVLVCIVLISAVLIFPYSLIDVSNNFDTAEFYNVWNISAVHF